jgi:isopenicillin N synthase-like dioxygenase
MCINHYPPSSDPSLTLGLPKHSDVSVNLFTILLQAGEVPGLQVLEDGKWLAVDPLPTAFVITIGYVFQVRTSPFLLFAKAYCF